MLSPAEMTACLPANSTPGHSYLTPLKHPLLSPAKLSLPLVL